MILCFRKLYYSLFLFIIFTSCKESGQKGNSEPFQKVSIADVEAGIRANIERKVVDGEGFFKYQDDSLNLSLKLVRVHTEYLSVLGKNRFFACVDLATIEGDVYDVDFFLSGTSDSMEVTSTKLHKINGKPFYSWKQKPDKSWITVPVKESSNRLLGVVEGSDEFTFNYEVILPEINGTADIWIPIPSNDAFQTIENVHIKHPSNYSINTDPIYNNAILYSVLSNEASHDTISISYLVKRKEKAAYAGTVDSVLYLGSTALLPINSRFVEISDSAIAKKQASTPLTKARALYDYIIDNMRYAKQGKYGTGDANYACDSKSGNCTEFHSFFISLARSSGIPARFAVGAGIPSERNEGGVNGYHCWAEFYAEGKWWPVDISEANKYTALATYYFGHHPANRIELSKGRDIEPYPLPKSGPINFFAYPVFEMGGELIKVETNFSFERKNVSN